MMIILGSMRYYTPLPRTRKKPKRNHIGALDSPKLPKSDSNEVPPHLRANDSGLAAKDERLEGLGLGA